MINRMKRITTDLVSSKERTFFYDLFQRSRIGQVVVDRNLDILYANNQMLQCLQSKVQNPANRSFGGVFNCTALPDGRRRCGEAERCGNCKIWGCTRQILLDETPAQDLIQYSFRTKTSSIEKWFQLSGTQVTWRNKQYAALTFSDISEIKCQERCLKKKLTLDLATGTLNKTSLMNSLRQILESGEKNCHFTICMIDFDHFKLLNDRYGHLMGDKVLEVFSEIARNHIRKDDMIGRYGGEEFIFIFYKTGQRQALQILGRIHKELGAYFSEEIKIPVTFSAGAVYVESVRGVTQYTDLLGDVDRMLYQAKEQGRGRAVSSIGEIVFTGSAI